mmetsp:Transcript_98510/g.239643  ORF Transcript_98510/g.239643 Transcript_98510/m.239643 type:complete len:106 (-) Transcript_98510:99-416(-)
MSWLSGLGAGLAKQISKRDTLPFAVGAVAAYVILPKFAYNTDPEADGIGSAAKSYWVKYYRSDTVPQKEGHAEAHAPKLSPEEARIAEVMEHITKIEKSLGIEGQ